MLMKLNDKVQYVLRGKRIVADYFFLIVCFHYWDTDIFCLLCTSTCVFFITIRPQFLVNYRKVLHFCSILNEMLFLFFILRVFLQSFQCWNRGSFLRKMRILKSVSVQNFILKHASKQCKVPWPFLPQYSLHTRILCRPAEIAGPRNPIG